jgi:DNA-binding Lrp family transcriptional regulator
MAIMSFVLIQPRRVEHSRSRRRCAPFDGVTTWDVVTGPYDVIAKVREATLDDLAKLVDSKIQAIDGITRTYTCPVFTL